MAHHAAANRASKPGGLRLPASGRPFGLRPETGHDLANVVTAQFDLAVGHADLDSIALDRGRKLGLIPLAKVDQLGSAGPFGRHRADPRHADQKKSVALLSRMDETPSSLPGLDFRACRPHEPKIKSNSRQVGTWNSWRRSLLLDLHGVHKHQNCGRELAHVRRNSF